MRRKLTLFLALLSTMSIWATEVTTVATAGSYLTLDQLKALSGTGGHVAFANVGSGNWTNKWLANPSANSNLTLSTVQLYTLTDGSVSGKYYMQRVSDSQYRTGSGWGDQASAENIEFRAYTNSATTVACTDPISIHNNSGTQWNINAGSFGGALNAWAAYAAYGPFYILEVTCIDDDTNETLQATGKQIVTNGHTMDIPTYAGKKLVDGSPASIVINGADAVYELHYVASSFDYTLVVNGAVEGMTMTINGDAITSGQTAYSSASAVAVDDVVVTFPSEYSYMTAKVTISGTTITVNCEDTRWPVNFDKSQTFTRSDRHINSASFNGQIVDGIYENTSTTCYQDLTATKTVVLPTSTSIKPSFAMTGIWQHGFVYIDLNNDGDFTDAGELVSKINEGNPDLSTAIPAFISPATAGTYRMRFKTDWASEDPGGNEGEEPGNVNGNNHIIKNGGMIVDVTLKTVSPFVRLSAQETGTYLLEGLTYGNETGNASIWYYDGTKLYNFKGGFDTAVTFSNAATAGTYSITAGEALGKSFAVEDLAELPVGISAASYATLYSPVALAIPTGVTAYVASDKGEYLSLTAIEGGVIPANTGVVLAGDEGTYNFALTTGGSVEDNVLTGTIVAISRPENSYILATGTSGVGFYKDGASTIPGFKSYLPASAGGEVKTFRFGDDATAITDLNANVNLNESIFNLAGQKVNGKLPKGIYIVNGKKMVNGK